MWDLRNSAPSCPSGDPRLEFNYKLRNEKRYEIRQHNQMEGK